MCETKDAKIRNHKVARTNCTLIGGRTVLGFPKKLHGLIQLL